MSISVRKPRISGIERAITKIESSVQSCPVGFRFRCCRRRTPRRAVPATGRRRRGCDQTAHGDGPPSVTTGRSLPFTDGGGSEGIRQRPDAPLAGAELALPYLLDDADFAAFARRAASGAARARVSEPLLARSSPPSGRHARGRAARPRRARRRRRRRPRPVRVGLRVPARRAPWPSCRRAAPRTAPASSPPPHLAGERSRALHTLAAGGLVAVSADALVERAPSAGRRGRAPVELRLGEERPFDELTRRAGRARDTSAPTRSRSAASSRSAAASSTSSRRPAASRSGPSSSATAWSACRRSRRSRSARCATSTTCSSIPPPRLQKRCQAPIFHGA